MKVHEYVNMSHSTDAINFREVIFPQLVNAYWTSNGESYYPCVLFDDYQTADTVYVATKSLGMMPHPRKCVFPISEVEDAFNEDSMEIAFG